MSIFKQTPSSDASDYVISIVGGPGVGKTTFFVDAGALLLDFERGFKAIECDAVGFQDDQLPPLDWDQLELARLESSGGWSSAPVWIRFKVFLAHFLRPTNRGKYGDFSLLCVDTIDACFESCVDYVCRRNNWKTPDDGGKYGKGWAEVLAEFKPVVQQLLDFRARTPGVGLGFISHSKVRTVKSFGEEARDKETAALAPSAAKWLFSVSDFVLFAEVTARPDGSPVRVLHSQPSVRFDAKSRGARSSPFPSPISLDYQAFAAAWTSISKGNLEELSELEVELFRREEPQTTSSVWS